jgi:phosphate transporter
MDRARQFAKRLSLGNVRESFTSSSQEQTIWNAKTNYAWDTRLLFKRRITNLYVTLSALKSYVDTNHSGFRKILKK